MLDYTSLQNEAEQINAHTIACSSGGALLFERLRLLF